MSFTKKIETVLIKLRSCSSGILIFFIFTAIYLLYLETLKLNMHLSTQESFHYYFAKYVASAISSLQYDLTGYVGFNKIFTFIFEKGTINDQILSQAINLKDVNSDGVYKITQMDLGYCTFAYLSFLIFGFKVKSFVYCYFLILVLSAVLFIVEFRKDKFALSVLLIFLISYFFTSIRSSEMPGNVGVIYSMRFMSLLAVLPMLHLSLLLFSSKLNLKTKTISLLIVVTQLAFIAWICFIRSSVQWMLLAIFILIVLKYIMYFFNSIKERSNLESLNRVMVAFLLVSIISKVLINFSMDDVYKKKGELGAHVFWHSLYVGLALHPEIRREFTKERIAESNNQTWQEKSLYRPNDGDAYSAVFNWLKKENESVYKVFNFTENDRVEYQSIFSYFSDKVTINPESNTLRKIDMEYDYNWGVHEEILKKIVFEVLVSHPRYTLEAFFIIKPLKFIHIYKTSYLKNSSYLKVMSFFKSQYLYVTFVLIFLAVYLGSEGVSLGRYLFATIYIFIFDMIIPIVFYPEPWNMADQVVILNVVLGVFVVLGLSTIHYFLKRGLERQP